VPWRRPSETLLADQEVGVLGQTCPLLVKVEL